MNNMDISNMPVLSDHQKLIYRYANDRSQKEYITHINYITKINIKIPITLFPDEFGDVKITALIKKFGSQVMTIYNAILCEKRVIFLGYGCSSSEVSEYVIASICMLCPPLKGILSQRAYPYTNLTYLDFLSVYPIYIYLFIYFLNF
jgi:hypothetical protein